MRRGPVGGGGGGGDAYAEIAHVQYWDNTYILIYIHTYDMSPKYLHTYIRNAMRNGMANGQGTREWRSIM